jgi:adenylate cyclase
LSADEEGTPSASRRICAKWSIRKIREGRIVKTNGDGVLAEFASVVDAVRCAGEIQHEMAGRDPKGSP